MSGKPEDSNDQTSEDIPTFQNENWLSTGLETLDRKLGGGIPPGRLVAFTAPPDTQSELLLKVLTTQRKTLYLTTLRPKWEVQEELADHLQKNDGAKTINVYEVSAGELLANPKKYIAAIGSNSNIIIDSVNEFERENRDQYKSFLNELKKRLWKTGSIGIFYGINEQHENPPHRSITLRRADLIWQLRASVDANSIETHLIISKFRGGRALTEPVKLELRDEIAVDSTRDIQI